ncbi:MAG: DUF6291 domain-containing protein [Bacteroides sp.]|nr:DUF6291 domain-containing protein [Bacteroides sp.]MCM1412763.1 DUF6291 domain-containing protein [Bacteroides sp.]MCM1470943.1 DUF6291 domain-containing protein [Bacteroides sp.]
MEITQFVARESFGFNRDWWSMLKTLPDDLRLRAYDAISGYAFEGAIPDDQLVNAVTILIRFAIDKDANKRRKRTKKCVETSSSSHIEQDGHCVNDNVNNNIDENEGMLSSDANTPLPLNEKEEMEEEKNEKIEEVDNVIKRFFEKSFILYQLRDKHKIDNDDIRRAASDVKDYWLQHDEPNITDQHFISAIRNVLNNRYKSG